MNATLATAMAAATRAASDPAVAALYARIRHDNQQIRTRAAAAADLLDEIRDQADALFGPDVDGLTLTARGGFFGAWSYRDDYDLVHTGRVSYLDDDLDALDERILADTLAAYAAIGPDEHVRRGDRGRTLIHLNP